MNSSVNMASLPLKKKLYKKVAGFTAFENNDGFVVGVSVMGTRKDDNSFMTAKQHMSAKLANLQLTP